MHYQATQNNLLSYPIVDLQAFLIDYTGATMSDLNAYCGNKLELVERIVDLGWTKTALEWLGKPSSSSINPHKEAGLANVQAYLAHHGAFSTVLGDKVVVMMKGDSKASHITTRAQAVDYLAARFI